MSGFWPEKDRFQMTRHIHKRSSTPIYLPQPRDRCGREKRTARRKLASCSLLEDHADGERKIQQSSVPEHEHMETCKKAEEAGRRDQMARGIIGEKELLVTKCKARTHTAHASR